MAFLNALWKNKMVQLGVITLITLLFFKFALPFLMPFVIAFLFVLIFHPILHKIHKKIKIPEGILAGILLAVVAALLLLGAWFLLCRGMDLIGDMQQNTDYLRECCMQALKGCCDFIESKTHISSRMMQNKVVETTQNLVASLQDNFAPKALDASKSYAGSVFEGVFCIAITVIAIVLLIKDYDEIKEKLETNPLFVRIRQMGRKILTLLKIYVKAQLIIVSCVIATAMAGLFASGVERWYLWGPLTGFLDMLPFVGSGIVLVPLSIFGFLQGKIWQGIGCLILYGICTFLRQILEPKLVGEKLNIYPIFILLSVFFGIHFYNIGGILLGPVSLFLIREIYQELQENEK